METVLSDRTGGATSLRVRLLGPLTVGRDGATLDLPASRKVRALLAYLALAHHRVTRSHLCELLWDVPDDPRSELRWCLSKLRSLVDEPGRRRVETEGDTIRLDLSDAFVDAVEIAAAAQAGLRTVAPERLRTLAALFAGNFLEGLEIDRSPAFDGWLTAQRRRLRGTHAAILEHLVARAPDGGDLGDIEKWLELAPFDPRVHELLLSALARRGRIREGEEHLAATTKLFEAEGLDGAPIREAWRAARSRTDPGNGASGPKVQPDPRNSPASDDEPTRCEPTRCEPARLVGKPAAPQEFRQARWPSVAVLPLRSVSGDSAIPHLADAITEDLVTSLSRDRGIAIIAHGAILGAERVPLDVRQIAQQIGAQYLVEGSVRRAGNTLVVAVRLIDGLDARRIWGERCVQRLDASLAIEEQLARKIAAAVRDEVEYIEARKAQFTAPEQLDARASYHLGLREMYRFTRAGLVAAQGHFERAVGLDPNLAPTHARLSDVHIQRYWDGSREGREAALDEALVAAELAVALDPKEALGYLAMGRVHALRRQFDLAMPELEEAIRLNPSLAQAYFGLGQALGFAGRGKEAVRLLDTAIELNPHDPHLWSFFHDQSEAYFALGRFDDAERSARAAARSPNATYWPWVTLASVLGFANEREQASHALRELLSRRPDYSLSRAETDFAHLSDKSFVAGYLEGLQEAGLAP